MSHRNFTVDFFLGAVGLNGFHCFYDSLRENEKIHLVLLKSGPGCGKSTIMKNISSRTNGLVELIHCSSDPHSLDGVIIKDLDTAILDATQPHSIEPNYPMLADQVVSLYQTIDSAKLKPLQAKIITSGSLSQMQHKKAALYIRSAAQLINESVQIEKNCINYKKLDAFIKVLSNKFFYDTHGEPIEEKRFLSAITPDGYIMFSDTIKAYADHIIVLHDKFSACSSLILSHLRDVIIEKRFHFICCYCPINPCKIDHIIIPQIGLAILTDNPWHHFNFDGQKNIHCSRFINTAELDKIQYILRFNHKLSKVFVNQAICCLQHAKQYHQELEKFYIKSVDFNAVNIVQNKLIDELKL